MFIGIHMPSYLKDQGLGPEMATMSLALIGLFNVVGSYGVPWHVVRVGARVEFVCAPGPLRNGTQAEAAHAPALEQAVHLALLNRGCLIAPFHNMMLVSPTTTPAQVEALRQAFESVVASLALDLASWN